MRRQLLLWALAASTAAAAGEDAWRPREDNPAWRTECGACHIPFPPALLAPEDWLAIMADLEHHFGANARLDEKTRQEVSAFLERNAGAGRGFGNREEAPRITGTDWFVRKHQGAIRLWRKGRLKSLAECTACHKGPDIERMTAD